MGIIWPATSGAASKGVGPFSIKHDTAYWASVADKLVSGVKQAQPRLEPARLGIVSSTAAAANTHHITEAVLQ
ncbi:MAG: hypothetical protein GXY83_36705 [Rhodopirellula sp.]|nr:hypothetical protein [Rhodopirellula sp.]